LPISADGNRNVFRYTSENIDIPKQRRSSTAKDPGQTTPIRVVGRIGRF